MNYRHQRRVSFSDTDAAGFVHFSQVLCYVEEAEHTLLESLGIPLLEDGGWPRVSVECEYTAPMMPRDTLEIVISPEKLGDSSILWRFKIANQGGVCASGLMKTVYVDKNGKPAPIDTDWREKLGA